MVRKNGEKKGVKKGRRRLRQREKWGFYPVRWAQGTAGRGITGGGRAGSSDLGALYSWAGAGRRGLGFHLVYAKKATMIRRAINTSLGTGGKCWGGGGGIQFTKKKD